MQGTGSVAQQRCLRPRLPREGFGPAAPLPGRAPACTPVAAPTSLGPALHPTAGACLL